MDKEALRRQLEDLEEASERWRTEKRRLNAEIDKLEAALADAKAAAARSRVASADLKAQGLDAVSLVKLQQAADEKLTKATTEWETERAKLKSQINRLEGAVAEAITRASNPMRATQSVKEQFEVELSRVAKEKTELEQAFLRGKTEWEQEKLRMTGEMVKLRRAAQIMGRPVPKEAAPEINPKVIDLEKQLKDNLAKWNSEREQLAMQIQKLEEAARQFDSERRHLNDHAAELQQAFEQAQAKIQKFEVAARAPSLYEARLDELKGENQQLQGQLDEAQRAWDTERRQLNNHAAQLQQAFVQAQAKVQKFEAAAQAPPQQAEVEKLKGEKEQQQRQSDEAQSAWNAERRKLSDQASQLHEDLLQAQARIQKFEVAARAPHPSESKVEELAGEKERLQRQLLEAEDKWNKERGRMNSEVERLLQQLQRMSETRDRVSDQVVDQLRKQYDQKLQEAIQQKTQLAQELQSASTMLESERTRLSAAHAGGGGDAFDADAIRTEVARVEGLISQIIAVIDNPDTDLSTVIRKNVEKAELDAYLKGILFSLEKK